MDRNAVKLPTRSRTFRLDQARRVQKRFFPQFSPPSDTHISEWLEGSPDEAYNRLAKILEEKTVYLSNRLEELKLKPLRVPMEMPTGRKIKKLRLW
jgi:hypothetical protein